jgi:predicted RNase H-like nuclease (RuvC/YqgF family)
MAEQPVTRRELDVLKRQIDDLGKRIDRLAADANKIFQDAKKNDDRIDKDVWTCITAIAKLDQAVVKHGDRIEKLERSRS